MCGVWGLVAVGIFARKDSLSEGFSFNYYDGFLHGEHEVYLLGVQCLAAVTFAAWASLSTFIILKIIDMIFPLRAGKYIQNLNTTEGLVFLFFHPTFSKIFSRYLFIYR